jgi:hypothetical protein
MPHFECGAFNRSATSPELGYIGFSRGNKTGLYLVCYRIATQASCCAQGVIYRDNATVLHAGHDVRIEV